MRNRDSVNEIVENEWKIIIDDLRKFIEQKSLLPFFDKIKIEDRLWTFLNLASNNFVDGFENESTDRILSYYLIQKKDCDDSIYKYIKKIITSIFISKSINLYRFNDSSFWNDKRIIIDTRFLMNILDMNCIEENESSKELYEILRNNTKCICTFNHNVEEIYYVIEAYNYQKGNFGYISTNIDLFNRENYNKSQISIFQKGLNKNIENLGILILNNNTETGNKIYLDEFNNNYGNVNNSFTKKFDENNYICTLSEYEKDKGIVFVSTSSSLYNIYKKCHKESDNIVFISESDLASLYFINNTSNCSKYSINKALSVAYMLQEPSEEFYKSLLEALNKLKNNGGITEETIILYAHDNMIAKEIGIETGYISKNITSDSIMKVLDKYRKDLNSPLLNIINEKELELNKYTEETSTKMLELNRELSKYKDEVKELNVKDEIKEKKIEVLEDRVQYVEKEKEELKKPVEKLDKIIDIVSTGISIILLALLILAVIYIIIIIHNAIKKNISQTLMSVFLGLIVSFGTIIAIASFVKKFFIIIRDAISNRIRDIFYK